MNKEQTKFCEASILDDVVDIISRIGFSNSIDLKEIYKNWNSAKELKDLAELPYSSLHDTNYHYFLDQNAEYRNIGIDLPVWFGDFNSDQSIMLIAMDPKRNSGEPNEISLNAVFSLHESVVGLNVRKNDYWKFIKPLTEKNFVYVTDAYKLYYERTLQGKKVLSNKDNVYKGRDSACLNLNREILQKEIDLVGPKKVIAMGNEAISTVKMLLNIESDEQIITDNGVSFVFMPHIVRTVTSQVSTIGRLFETVGFIKGDKNIQQIGKDILYSKDELFK